MGPHRIIHNRRGYLTETYFDAASGQFCERPFPPMADEAPSKPSGAPVLHRTAIDDCDIARGTALSDPEATTGADGAFLPPAEDSNTDAPQS